MGQVVSPAIHISLFLTIIKSSVLPFFIVPTSFCFCLFYFSTIYLFLLVVPGVSECLWSSQSVLQSAMPPSCIMLSSRGHLRNGILPPNHPPQACVSLDW